MGLEVAGSYRIGCSVIAWSPSVAADIGWVGVTDDIDFAVYAAVAVVGWKASGLVGGSMVDNQKRIFVWHIQSVISGIGVEPT